MSARASRIAAACLLLFVAFSSCAENCNRQLHVIALPLDRAANLRARVLQFSTIPSHRSTSFLNASLEKEGFHRDLRLSTSVSITDDLNQYMILFILPKETYVDVYELENLSRVGQLPPFSARGTIDVEQPSYRTDYEVMLAVSETCKGPKRDWSLSAVVPVHLRYQEPSDVQHYAPVSVLPPFLLARYRNSKSLEITLEELEAIGDSSSGWRRLEVRDTHYALNTEVPVGFRGHETFVFAGTLLLTMGGGAYLIWIILTHKF